MTECHTKLIIGQHFWLSIFWYLVGLSQSHLVILDRLPFFRMRSYFRLETTMYDTIMIFLKFICQSNITVDKVWHSNIWLCWGLENWRAIFLIINGKEGVSNHRSNVVNYLFWNFCKENEILRYILCTNLNYTWNFHFGEFWNYVPSQLLIRLSTDVDMLTV